MKTSLLFSLLTFSVFASDLPKRPAPFQYAASQAVFADFTDAKYEITYDFANKVALAKATIELETAEAGYPIFDSQVDPTMVSIDGNVVGATLTQTPAKETTVRVVNLSVPAGKHVLKINLPITQLVEFNADGVKSAFWMSDLSERGYLERYIPTNFLFDRIPMTFKVKFIGSPSKQIIYANGDVEILGNNEFKVTYRENLNTSCQYFHAVPEGSTVETRFSFKSIDGREIPSVVYMSKEAGDQTAKLASIKAQTLAIIEELEKDYGAFLHPSLTVYIAGAGGMEYSGATMTSESALGHELSHSYFARGVMPSDGNAGWIDEALASWRDRGYSTINTLTGTSKMGDHGTYNRITDRLAYTFGERFMALLDGKMKAKGGLKPYLRDLVTHQSFAPLNVGDFNQGMNVFYGESFDADFKKYVFGEGKADKMMIAPMKDNDIHRQLSLKELQELL